MNEKHNDKKLQHTKTASQSVTPYIEEADFYLPVLSSTTAEESISNRSKGIMIPTTSTTRSNSRGQQTAENVNNTWNWLKKTAGRAETVRNIMEAKEKFDVWLLIIRLWRCIFSLSLEVAMHPSEWCKMQFNPAMRLETTGGTDWSTETSSID